MTFFMFLRPSTYPYIVAPMELAKLPKRQRKSFRKIIQEEEQRKRRRQQEEDAVLLSLGLLD